MMVLQPQELPLDHPDAGNMFQPSPSKPFFATSAALELYGREAIHAGLRQLQAQAQQHGGLDYLQVFIDPDRPEPLWFIEDGEGGAITALLPSDY